MKLAIAAMLLLASTVQAAIKPQGKWTDWTEYFNPFDRYSFGIRVTDLGGGMMRVTWHEYPGGVLELPYWAAEDLSDTIWEVSKLSALGVPKEER